MCVTYYRDWPDSCSKVAGRAVLEQSVACLCCRHQQQQSSQEAEVAIQAGDAGSPTPGEGGDLPTERGCGMSEIFKGRRSGTWQWLVGGT